MIKGGEVRKADFPIEPLILDRWLPRAMSGEEISTAELMRLFEAARWAPSSFNAQCGLLIKEGRLRSRSIGRDGGNPSLLGRPRRSTVTSDF